MTPHVVIRNESYVAGSAERPEVGVFTQTHATRPPVPWGRLAAGDLVWMKWKSGPIVASARVARFTEIADCTPDRLRQQTFGYLLYDLDSYWEAIRRKPSFFAVVVYLEHERWLDAPLTPSARTYGESWVVLDTPELELAWLGDGGASADVAGPAIRPPRPSRKITPSVRFAVFRRDGFTCQYCGGHAPQVVLHVDHRRSIARGGTDDFENLVTACSVCNHGKGARSPTLC